MTTNEKKTTLKSLKAEIDDLKEVLKNNTWQHGQKNPFNHIQNQIDNDVTINDDVTDSESLTHRLALLSEIK